MKARAWLVLQATYAGSTVKSASIVAVRKSRPSVEHNQIAIPIELDVPADLFSPSPVTAKVQDPTTQIVARQRTGGDV